MEIAAKVHFLLLLSVFTVDLQAAKHVFIQDEWNHADVFM